MKLPEMLVASTQSFIYTGIGSRALRPLLGIIDPRHVRHMPKNVATYSGFDVLW